MNDFNDMGLDALRVELAYRRALLQPDSHLPRYRVRLPRKLRRGANAGSFTRS
jgi:hypothetical protein